MIRRPRSLFSSRLRGRILYFGPKFTGPPPNYMPALDALAASLAGRVEPGQVHHVGVFHDDDCSIFSGSACDCEPEVKLTDEPV